MSPKPYPTKSAAASVDGKRRRKRGAAIAKPRRVTPPEIYVHWRDPERPWRSPYARAHLRNKKGYVYLTWREGERVRTFYLGKAPRKSPTAAIGISAPIPHTETQCPGM